MNDRDEDPPDGAVARTGLLLWRQALVSRALWTRALPIGLVVGAVQVAINQGDAWMNHAADGTVVLKTIATPVVALTVAVISGAATQVATRREKR